MERLREFAETITAVFKKEYGVNIKCKVYARHGRNHLNICIEYNNLSTMIDYEERPDNDVRSYLYERVEKACKELVKRGNTKKSNGNVVLNAWFI